MIRLLGVIFAAFITTASSAYALEANVLRTLQKNAQTFIEKEIEPRRATQCALLISAQKKSACEAAFEMNVARLKMQIATLEYMIKVGEIDDDAFKEKLKALTATSTEEYNLENTWTEKQVNDIVARFVLDPATTGQSAPAKPTLKAKPASVREKK